MKDKTRDADKLLKRPLRRRDILKGGLAGTALLTGASTIFAPRIVRAAGGSITIGSFQDNAMAPFRDYFVKQFASETGIAVTKDDGLAELLITGKTCGVGSITVTDDKNELKIVVNVLKK